jgi:Cu/Ag efflux protein CusF
MKANLLRILPFLLLALMMACGGSGNHSTHNTSTASPSPSSSATGPNAAVATRTYNAVGTVKALNFKAPAIEIAHGDIEGLMPAMQMEFEVSDGSLLNGLAVNDLVDFTIEDRTSGMRVIAIKKQ